MHRCSQRTHNERNESRSHWLKLEDPVHGKLEMQEDYTQSAVGETLTEIDRSPGSGAIFENVFDKQ